MFLFCDINTLHKFDRYYNNNDIDNKTSDETKAGLIKRFTQKFNGLAAREGTLPYSKYNTISVSDIINNNKYKYIWDSFLSININLIETELKKCLKKHMLSENKEYEYDNNNDNHDNDIEYLYKMTYKNQLS